MGRSAKAALTAMLCSFTVISLISCGGGGSSSGDGGGTTPVAAPAQTIVSGTVQTPGGAIVFFKKPGFGDLFVSEAYAALTGLANVPDNTIVQLARLNATATSFSVISTTTTSGGRFSFNLSTLGVQPANDLIVRVAGPSGREMRAFVVGTVADISPVSETGYQLAVQSLNGGPLTNLTLQEVTDITGAVSLISTLQNIGNATSIEQAVALVKAAVGSDVSLTGFLVAAAAPGQTAEGAGDVGNYYPFDQGSIWRYSGSRIVSGQTLGYENTVLVSGQEPAPGLGVTSTIFSETNDEGENRAEKTFDVKGSSGITTYGNEDPGDNITRQLAPFKAVHFPLSLGVTTILAERSGLNWGNDEDGDGRNETFSAKLSQTVFAMEQIAVSAGTFPNSIGTVEKAIFTVNLTRGGAVTLIQTNTVWHAPGVGRVKELVQATIDGEPIVVSLSEELLGYVVNGSGSGLRVEISPSSVSLVEGRTTQLHATAFDQANNPLSGIPFAWATKDPAVATVSPTGLVTATAMGTTDILISGGSNVVPVTIGRASILPLATNDLVYDNVSQKLYVSQPGSPGSIRAVDPATGTVGPATVVGNEPNKIAISADGQSLFVSLDAESAMLFVSLPAMTAGLKSDLGPPLSILPTEKVCASDIKVLPGSNRDVAVARYRHGGVCYVGAPLDVRIYQDGVSLPNSYSGNIGIIEFSDTSSLLYGYNRFDTGQNFARMSINPSGVSLIDDTTRLLGFSRDMKQASGLVYMGNGEILDPVNLRITGSLSQSGWAVRPDPSLKKVFVITSERGDAAKLLVYDLDSLRLLGSLEIPGLRGFPFPPNFLPRLTSLVRWGTDGVAFRTSTDEVVIVRSPLVSSVVQ